MYYEASARLVIRALCWPRSCPSEKEFECPLRRSFPPRNLKRKKAKREISNGKALYRSRSPFQPSSTSAFRGGRPWQRTFNTQHHDEDRFIQCPPAPHCKHIPCLLLGVCLWRASDCFKRTSPGLKVRKKLREIERIEELHALRS